MGVRPQGQNVRFHREDPRRADLPAVVAGRNLEGQVADRVELDLAQLAFRSVGEHEADLGAIVEAAPLTGFLVVVHRKVDRRSGLELHRVAGLHQVALGAQGDAAQRVAAELAECRPAARRLDARAHVMDVAAADLELDATHPDRLRQHLLGQFGPEVDVDVGDVVGHPVLFGHLDDEIGTTQRPTARAFLDEPLRRRRVGLVTGGRTVTDPGQDRLDLAVRHHPLVVKLPAGRLGGEPGRHRAVLDRARDGARPGARLLVRHQRHRRDHAADVLALAVGPVTGLAVLLQDRQHVGVEGGRVRVGGQDDARKGNGGGKHDEDGARGRGLHVISPVVRPAARSSVGCGIAYRLGSLVSAQQVYPTKVALLLGHDDSVVDSNAPLRTRRLPACATRSPAQQ